MFQLTHLFDLTGKVALVTGSSRGLGYAIAEGLAKAGATLILNGRNNDSLLQAQQEFSEKGYSVHTACFDVTDSEAIKTQVANIQDTIGTIDILVNNAGTTRDNVIMMLKPEDFDSVINTNLRSAWLCSKSASRLMMKKRQGRIINITSVVGIAGNGGQTNYAASKAGMIGLTKSLAKEIAPRGITVNAVAPGFIETDMTSELGDDIRETAISHIPLGRMGTPDDVAKAVAFLASDDAKYITGQVVVVDGGMVM